MSGETVKGPFAVYLKCTFDDGDKTRLGLPYTTSAEFGMFGDKPQVLRKTQVPPSGPKSCRQVGIWAKKVDYSNYWWFTGGSQSYTGAKNVDYSNFCWFTGGSQSYTWAKKKLTNPIFGEPLP